MINLINNSEKQYEHFVHVCLCCSLFAANPTRKGAWNCNGQPDNNYNSKVNVITMHYHTIFVIIVETKRYV